MLRGLYGKRKGGRPLRCLALLSGCFLLGAALGQVFASALPPETIAELRRCLRGALVQDGGAPTEFLLFVRLPLLTILSGLTSIAGLLLSGLALTAGFLLSFSVGCFTAAFGAAGVLLAAAAMGVRTLVTLPCFLLLAVSFLDAPGRGRRILAARLLFCAVVLFLGLCADLYLTPRLLRWALASLSL